MRLLHRSACAFVVTALTTLLGSTFGQMMPVSPLPMVGITASRPDTAEPSPTTRIAPGEFLVHHTGATNKSMTVYLTYEGTATSGKDYEGLPKTVIIPAGTNQVSLLVQPLQDNLLEGDETVIARLILPLNAIALAYQIDPAANAATVVIHDSTVGSGDAKITITAPAGGAQLAAGADVDINAVAVDPNGYMPRLEFYVDGVLLDVSEITFISAPDPGTPVEHHEFNVDGVLFDVSTVTLIRAPDPGTPVEHHVVWKKPAPGKHSLIAQGVDSRGQIIKSAPVTVVVGPGSSTVVVQVIAVDPIGTELPPTVDVIDPLRFEISRSGPTNAPLTVFFSLHGSAAPGVDYPDPGRSIVIAAGSASATLVLSPKHDTQTGPLETVGVRLEPSPLANPLAGYDIDPSAGEAAGVIYQGKAPTVPVLELVFPFDKEQVAAGQAVTLLAASYRPTAYIGHVDFYDGNQKIGSSDLVIDPLPGGSLPTLVFHRFDWKAPSAGDHALTARATLAGGTVLKSPAVTITVGGSTVSKATLKITAPKEAETFRFGSPVPLSAVAVDPEGYIPRLEFYADDKLVGVSEILFIRAPDPGTPITHAYVWTNAPAGTHVLTARGVDAHSLTVTSPPVKIVIEKSTSVSKVSITKPADGSVFKSGDSITVAASATNPSAGIKQLELLADGKQIATTNKATIQFTWKNASVGSHALVARALDGAGASVDSAPVRVLVEQAELTPFVLRKLPAGYTPGEPFEVQLIADPPSGTLAYAVEDLPPKGWAVTAVSDDGVFDTATGKVKFGPFMTTADQTLHYTVTPPKSAKGSYEFSGTASAAGTSSSIAGDHLIAPKARNHPADVNSDFVINLTELTTYAAAWKNGSAGTAPASYVTRAGYLWKHGEKYHYDASQPAPLCWVSDSPALASLTVTIPAGATRSVLSGADGASIDCTISVLPPSGGTAYAVEETVPNGCTVSNVNEGGVFDPASNTIRWGVFFDVKPRELSYSVASADPIDLRQFRGIVSSDGGTLIVVGPARPQVQLAGQAEGHVRLTLAGDAGQTYVLESSPDLVNWSPIQALFLPDGQLDYTDEGSNPGGQLFYRLRVR